jgi:soluble lytic murein transglycosylase-like protein
MRAPRLGGLVGATFAVALAATIMVFPVPAASEPRPEPSPLLAGDLEAARDPARARLVASIDGRISTRMPVLDAALRGRLARTIVLEAEAARIDPLLVLALIHVESAFDPRALSNRGAVGLMQLRETTMRREVERSGLALSDPHDPVANVQAGVRYLKRLLDAFGREEVALMAYNAGPNRILGYLREGEIPERFHVYPRRIKAELRRLRRSVGPASGPGAGAVVAQSRTLPVGE